MVSLWYLTCTRASYIEAKFRTQDSGAKALSNWAPGCFWVEATSGTLEQANDKKENQNCSLCPPLCYIKLDDGCSPCIKTSTSLCVALSGPSRVRCAMQWSAFMRRACRCGSRSCDTFTTFCPVILEVVAFILPSFTSCGQGADSNDEPFAALICQSSMA